MSRVRDNVITTEGAVVPALGLCWPRPKRVYHQKKQPAVILVVSVPAKAVVVLRCKAVNTNLLSFVT
jgi:hypothetical protein